MAATSSPSGTRSGSAPRASNAWKADSGGQLIPPHEEDSGNEELYTVVRGRARFTVGDEEADAPAGTLVFVPPTVFRTAVAVEDGTIVFVAGGTPGEAFGSHGWDSVTVAYADLAAGRVDEGRAIIEQLVAETPGHWGPHYNAGCFEALAGDADAALAHLRRAEELDTEGQSAQYFREDSDLDSLRDDPRFQELLA